MPSNLKRRAGTAEPALGTVNTDLTKSTPRRDPRFYPEPEEPTEPAAEGGLKVAGGKIAVSKQVLPPHPAGWPRHDTPFSKIPKE